MNGQQAARDRMLAELVAAAPPLTAEQRARIAALLGGAA